MRNVCKNISSRATGSFWRFCWNDSACTFFLLPLPNCFLRVCLPTLFAAVFFFSTTNNLWKFWHSKFQQISTYAFWGWDEIVTQEWNWSCPKILSKCTKTAPTLSTTGFIEWNLYLSWSNHLVTSFMLERNVGKFSKHQNETSDTDR